MNALWSLVICFTTHACKKALVCETHTGDWSARLRMRSYTSSACRSVVNPSHTRNAGTGAT
eukprot:9702308-Ditylum_brightwellii.AAC.1